MDSFDFMVRDSSFRDYGYYFQVGNINGDDYDDFLFSSRVLTGNSSSDSLAILYIYYGEPNFTFYKNDESIKFSSRYHTQNIPWSDWFRPNFSIDDINGDGIDDLIIGGISRYDLRDTTTIHFCSFNGIDTIPNVYLLDPDTTNIYINSGGISQNIGDFNNDGYDDFTFSRGIIILRLGGPYINNINPVGARGFTFGAPNKAVGVGDQNNDGFTDFAVCIKAYSQLGTGYVIIMLGQNRLVGINEEEFKIISNFKLYPNHPNPFNSTTILSWQLKEASSINIKIYDSLGSEIVTLINEDFPSGIHQTEFNAAKYNLSSGVYYCKLQIKGGGSSSIKMIYLK